MGALADILADLSDVPKSSVRGLTGLTGSVTLKSDPDDSNITLIGCRIMPGEEQSLPEYNSPRLCRQVLDTLLGGTLRHLGTAPPTHVSCEVRWQEPGAESWSTGRLRQSELGMREDRVSGVESMDLADMRSS